MACPLEACEELLSPNTIITKKARFNTRSIDQVSVRQMELIDNLNSKHLSGG